MKKVGEDAGCRTPDQVAAKLEGRGADRYPAPDQPAHRVRVEQVIEAEGQDRCDLVGVGDHSRFFRDQADDRLDPERGGEGADRGYRADHIDQVRPQVDLFVGFAQRGFLEITVLDLERVHAAEHVGHLVGHRAGEQRRVREPVVRRAELDHPVLDAGEPRGRALVALRRAPPVGHARALAREQPHLHVELLEARAALLEEFLTAREQADPKAVPQAMRDELEQVRTQIGERREAERRAREDVLEPEPTPQAAIPVEAPTSKTTNPKVNATLLTLGLASVVGGTVVLAVGARNSSQIDARVDEQLAALAAVPEYTEGQRQEFRDAIAAWEQDNRATARGMIVGGAVLAAAGVGLSAWGLVRIGHDRKHDQPSRTAWATPVLSREHIGLQLRIGF